MTVFEKRIAVCNLILQTVSLVILSYIGYVTSIYTGEQAKYTEEQARIAKVQNQPVIRWKESIRIDEIFGEVKMKELYNEGQEFNNIEEIHVFRFYSVQEKGGSAKLIPVLFKHTDDYNPNTPYDGYIGKGYVTAIYTSYFPYGEDGKLASLSGENEEIIRRTLIEAGLVTQTAKIQSNLFFVIDYQDIFFETHKKLYGWVNGDDDSNYDINNDPKFIDEFLNSFNSAVNNGLFIYYEDINVDTLKRRDSEKIEAIIKQKGISTPKTRIFSM